MFFQLTVACLATGAVLAALACWLTTQRGNTITDVLNAQAHLGPGEALNLAVLDKFRIATSVPVVALYIIAVLCAVALPLMFLYLNRLNSPIVFVSGAVDAQPRELAITTPFVVNGNQFKLSLPTNTSEQSIKIYAGREYAPVTMSFEVESSLRSIKYSVDGDQHWTPIDIDDSGSAHMQPIHLTPLKVVMK